ncbi:MAG TPA: hypothetical protein VGJ17_07570 [Candidatus Limnocylindrales bacterium]
MSGAVLTRERRTGVLALVLGVLLIGLAQRIAPLTEPPLYDGVYVPQPYVWLAPPAGAKGGAKGAKGSVGVEDGANKLVAVATPEQDPQAQVLATGGALVLPASSTSVDFSIEPVLPERLPADGHIDGNVYRIKITNQAGAPLTALASALVTVVMVSPHTDPDRTIELDTGQGWQALSTQNQGPGVWLAVVTQFGEFAVVAPGPATAPYPTATPAGGVLASSAPSGAPGSGGLQPSPSEDVPSIGVVGGPSPVPSTAPVAAGTSGGGLPVAPIAVVVALAALALIVVLWSRGRRKPPPPPSYRGAHRR